MPSVRKQFIFLAFFFLLNALSCSSTTQTFAPVQDIATPSIERLPKKGFYKVAANDTVYSIAWRYGLDYRYLAKINHISFPYSIHVGQIIYLRHNNVKSVNKIRPAISFTRSKPQNEHLLAVTQWHWPAQGQLVDSFSEKNKGINIAGPLNTSIYAAGPGKVVYSGNGLRGYGNLIIIKHNNVFLSAYAHNNSLWVKEGERMDLNK